MKLRTLYFGILFIVSLCFIRCTEPFKLVTQSFQDALVVEATITNELKHQEIKLSRTYALESENQALETNANVRIEDSNNNLYNFHETQSGVYQSNDLFQAVEGVSYQLLISTTDGKKYSSSKEYLPTKVDIDKVYTELVTKDGEEGIQVLVDSKAGSGDANFFRYEYEEAYKIVTPAYSPYDMVFSNVTNDGTDYTINFVLKSVDGSVCYGTNNSTNIILTSSNSSTENKVLSFPLRFIPIDDAKIGNRYSILVKQYVQSAEAYNFYKVLRDLGTDASVLVDNQPGFVQGNMFSQHDPNEKVIGFFDVSSVTVSNRLYFNYEDFELDPPPYFYDCNYLDLNTVEPRSKFMLYDKVQYGGLKFYSENNGIYTIVSRNCGDCTAFASNIRPEFWED